MQFIQDEYRWVDEITARMRELGIDVLFTCVPEACVAPSIYGERLPNVETITTLAGYVPDQLVGRARTSPRCSPDRRGIQGPCGAVSAGAPGAGQARDRAGLSRARGEQRPTLRHRLDRERPDLRRAVVPVSGVVPGHTRHREWSVRDRLRRSLERRAHEYLSEHPAASFDDVERSILKEHEGRAVINVIPRRASSKLRPCEQR